MAILRHVTMGISAQLNRRVDYVKYNPPLDPMTFCHKISLPHIPCLIRITLE
jgi:hypothetical protein